jgi:hypothetical protein
LDLKAPAARVGGLDPDEAVVLLHYDIGVSGRPQPFGKSRQLLGRLEADVNRRRRPDRVVRRRGP